MGTLWSETSESLARSDILDGTLSEVADRI